MPVYRTEYRVPFGDTDGMGIVYYANYLRLFEIARNEYFRDRVCQPLEMVRDEMFTIVVKAFVNYHSPARFDDELTIEAWIPAEKIQLASFQFDYRISIKKTGRKVATGFTVHALTTRAGKLKRMPKDFSELIKSVSADRPPIEK